MPLPIPIDQLAKRFGVGPEDVEAEMVGLGIPIVQFLGKRCVYERDIYLAHHQGEKQSSGRVNRVGNVGRFLEDLRRSGCIVEPLLMPDKRPVDCYSIRHKEGGDKTVGIKIQVCGKVQKGGGVHFNLGIPFLKDERIDWFVMIAPPFNPDSNYFARREDLIREARKRGYMDKASFPQRIKAKFNPYTYIETDILEILRDMGVGVFGEQRAAGEYDDAMERSGSSDESDIEHDE